MYQELKTRVEIIQQSIINSQIISPEALNFDWEKMELSLLKKFPQIHKITLIQKTKESEINWGSFTT